MERLTKQDTASSAGAEQGRSMPKGYKQTEVGVIPEDWESKSVENVSIEMVQGVNTAIDIPEYVESGVPMLKANNVIDNNIILDECDFVSQRTYSGYSERFKIKQFDFLFSNIGARLGTGSLFNFNEDATYAWNVMRIRPRKEDVFPYYFSHVLNSDIFYQQIQASLTGSGMGFVPKKILKDLKIPLPPTLTEQKAIATALSEVDALISRLDQLLTKKQAIKQGAMQELLTGKTRLKGFAGSGRYKQTEVGRIPEEWEVKTYDEVFHFLTTATFSRAELTPEGDIMCLHYGDIHTKFDHFIDFSQAEINSCSIEKGKKYPLLKNGDIIMADASEDYAGVGKSIEVKNLNKDAISGLHTFLLRDKDNWFTDGFRGYIHVMPPVKASLERLATGLKVYGVSKYNLKTIKIPIPTLAEQKAIATVLSDMDEAIALLESKKAKYQELKQGMMQELLTGKIRLV